MATDHISTAAVIANVKRDLTRYREEEEKSAYKVIVLESCYRFIFYLCYRCTVFLNIILNYYLRVLFKEIKMSSFYSLNWM